MAYIEPSSVVCRTTGMGSAVANTGKPIAAEMMANWFQLFVRGKTGNDQGLGLGLYIAAEIAKMHSGKVEAVSSAQETRFVFRMPLDGA